MLLTTTCKYSLICCLSCPLEHKLYGGGLYVWPLCSLDPSYSAQLELSTYLDAKEALSVLSRQEWGVQLRNEGKSWYMH